jgi:Flp pilus assembly protein TadD
MASGDAEAARRLLSETEAPAGGEGALALFRGAAAYRLGDLGDAAEKFAEAAKQHPDHRLAANWAAVVQARRGDLTGAVRRLQKDGLTPYDDLLLELALLFESHLLNHPEHRPPTGLDPPVLCEMLAGEFAKAPPPRRLSQRAIESAYQRGHHAALLAHAHGFLRSHATQIDGKWLVIHLMNESGMFDEALQASITLNEENPGIAPLLSQLGLVAIRAGDVRRAVLALSQVEIEGPEDFNCHWNLGLAALRASAEDEARWFFGKALRDYFIGSFEDSWLRLWNAVTSEHFLKM